MKDIEKFAVEPGSIWQVGRHVLACGDIEEGGGEQLLKFYEQSMAQRPSMVYTDPPWTQALATNFRRRAGLNNPVTFRAFIARMLSLTAKVPGLAFIEIGAQQNTYLAGAIEAAGYVEQGVVPITYTYYKTRRCYLHWASLHTGSNGYAIAGVLQGLDDEVTPERAIKEATAPGAVVFEPCLGQGLTALAAARASRVCLGMELNPKRLSTSLARMEKLLDITPVEIGDLYSV